MKIASHGASDFTKNNSLHTGAASLPAETTASQPFGVWFRRIAGNDEVRREDEELLGLRDGGRQHDMFLLFQIDDPCGFFPHHERGEARIRQHLSAPASPGVQKEKAKEMWEERKDLLQG